MSELKVPHGPDVLTLFSNDSYLNPVCTFCAGYSLPQNSKITGEPNSVSFGRGLGGLGSVIMSYNGESG